MQISTVLGNGMVLQREVQNPVWGYTRPGEKVQLIIGEHHLETQSDKDGYFEILLPSMKAGGPWEIRLWDTTGRYVFQDVLLEMYFFWEDSPIWSCRFLGYGIRSKKSLRR